MRIQRSIHVQNARRDIMLTRHVRDVVKISAQNVVRGLTRVWIIVILAINPPDRMQHTKMLWIGILNLNGLLSSKYSKLIVRLPSKGLLQSLHCLV